MRRQYRLTHYILLIFVCINSSYLLTAEHKVLCKKETPLPIQSIDVNKSQTNYPNEHQGKHIAHIELTQLNVFNTQIESQNNALFRFANDTHITTKSSVIINNLLFKIGDVYSKKRLLESERLLRSKTYLYDARVYAKEDCNGQIHVEVVTQDLWTLLPDISFSRKGGENASRIGFKESNLFGWGKRLSISNTRDKERSGYLFVYDDPNILTSHYRGRVEYADNDDGRRHLFNIQYPFFSIETPFSYGFLHYRDERTESIFEFSNTASEFIQKTDISHIFVGRSRALNEDWTQRLTLGFRREKQYFDSLPTTQLPLAADRILSYPYIQGHWFENDYSKVRNFDSIYRTEDLSLGLNIHALLGYSAHAKKGGEPHVIFSFSANKIINASKSSIFRAAFSVDTQWNTKKNQSRNFILHSQLQYYLQNRAKQSWFANITFKLAKNLTLDRQVSLGGDSGLRGFPLYYVNGTRSLLINIEKRYYWEYNLLHLFRVGAAAFFDIGQVNGRSQVESSSEILKNIGVGLRLAPSKANADIMLHLNLAMPINAPQNIDNFQWTFTVKNRF